ncbi:glycoside hydrolase family 2 protein [Roseateles oligotrophus]|uniref:Beta-glucuronidase n=1 Tax=Roseateles oligotrophus TaxID=1769250 RepID=A0ABT2YAB7_9BURK|nr:glycoside hydrolase family 2 TIM barrel-domain containing protein [Roseateles oligotrophus]MCV2367243.1 beta-glucuronidase [Roseateles oligotrophus]
MMARLLLALLWLLLSRPVIAQDAMRPALLLTGRTEALYLSGRWTYSKDLYRTGLNDINGWFAKSRMQRHRDIDIATQEAKGGTGFFEFDLDRGPAVEIPGAWNTAAQELRYYDGLIWFQRKFDAAPKPGQRSFLRFEAVNYGAHIYLNGKEVGRHEGGFTPLVLEVTGQLRASDNRLVVGADSRLDGQTIPGEITDWDLYGGITRQVKLIHTPPTFIDDATLRLTEVGHLSGSLQLNAPQAANQMARIHIAGLSLQVDARTDAQGGARFDLAAPAALQRWSPETPTPYKVEFSACSDRIQDRIGLRTRAIKGSEILLNGNPIFLRGVSLHEEELGANPARRIDTAAARALLTEVKQSLNGNYVRLAHYPHSETMLRLTDELGLLVWSEFPVYWTVDWDNPAVLQKARTMQAETLYRNRAALVLWGIGNETPVAENRTRFHAALAADKPLIASEFGADALAGHHDSGSPPRKWSEEFQSHYYRATLRTLATSPNLRGMSPWVLKDFRSPRREHPIFQNGWNRKGLLSETGQRKLAFEVLAKPFEVLAKHYREISL